MKTIRILRFYSTILALAVIIFLPVACNGEQQEEMPEVIPDNTITMTTQASKVSISFQIPKSAGSDNFAIDWGDGKISNIDDFSFHEPNPYSDVNGYIFEHSYSVASEHRITFTGGNIELLNCSWYQLTTLDVSRYHGLKYLACVQNQLTTLVLNPELIDLFCYDNPLTSLDVSNCTALINLNASNCRINTLDVSNCTALIGLDASNCSLNTLDVRKNPELGVLFCSDNQLKSLDVSNNTKLGRLYCNNNQLTTSALNELFGVLPDTSEWEFGGGWICFEDNPGTNDCDFSIATKKGWEHWHFGQKSWTMEVPVELYLNFKQQKRSNNKKDKKYEEQMCF